MQPKWAMDISKYDSQRWVFGKGYQYDLPINWTMARSMGGLSMAIIKSSEALHVDPAFRMNWTGAKGILPRMAYHFLRCNVSASAQEKFVLSILSDDFDNTRDFLALDFETKDGMTGSSCLASAKWFVERMAENGIIPLIYTYPSFWREIGGEKAFWALKYPLWLAQWPLDNWIANTTIQLPPYLFTLPLLENMKHKIETDILKPVTLTPWSSPAIWQFTARADPRAIPGHPALKKACDYNAVYLPMTANPPLPPLYTDYLVIHERINVRAGPSSSSLWIRYAVRGDILHIVKFKDDYAQATDGTWVFAQYIVKK